MISTTIFPGRYVQGDGALSLLPEEVARLGGRAVAIVGPVAMTKVAAALKADVKADIALEPFSGECCDEEIGRLAGAVKARRANVVVGVGGGKALDTAKAVADVAGLPVIVAPTLASTDAPCSALSIVYTPEGTFKRAWLQPRSPAAVLVDTSVIVEAPVRLLVAGMGDALSTRFEAEDCQTSGALNTLGRRGSMTAYAMARLCYDTLLENGAKAKAAGEARTVTPEFERIVEANTLLSGLGFESGGLSGAHAIHNGLTFLPGTHGFWHGEKVAVGTLALLFLTKRPAAVVDEAFGFCRAVGLPATFAEIGLAGVADAQLLEVARVACAPADTMGNVPGNVQPADVVAALKDADAEGRRRAA